MLQVFVYFITEVFTVFTIKPRMVHSTNSDQDHFVNV